jgi:TolA-binding protein
MNAGEENRKKILQSRKIIRLTKRLDNMRMAEKVESIKTFESVYQNGEVKRQEENAFAFISIYKICL